MDRGGGQGQLTDKEFQKKKSPDIPGGLVVKNLPANAEDTVLIPGPGRAHLP